MYKKLVFINNTIEKIKIFIFIIKSVFLFQGVFVVLQYTIKHVLFTCFPQFYILHSAIGVLEKFTQNQSRPEEITLREDYHNVLLFQDGNFGENIWEIKITS